MQYSNDSWKFVSEMVSKWYLTKFLKFLAFKIITINALKKGYIYSPHCLNKTGGTYFQYWLAPN